MKKHWLITTALFAITATGVWAADAPDAGKAPTAAPAAGHERTLEEARQHAHEYADKLDKMTPQEWAERQKKRHDWREKWHNMTPEEKKAWVEKRHKERAEHQAQDKPKTTAMPAAGGQ